MSRLVIGVIGQMYNKDGAVIDTIKAPSVTAAATACNGQESHISECIAGIPHRNTHKGYEWHAAPVNESTWQRRTPYYRLEDTK